MDTKIIQRTIYYHCKGKQNFMVSNKHLHAWHECDFISISKADYLTEYEIKVSKSDYKRDFIAKKVKHAWFEGKRNGDILIESSETLKETIVDQFTPNFMGIQQTVDMTPYRGPNYFYYICPENLIALEEIPDYAGLIYVADYNKRVGKLTFIKKAPILHKNKTQDDVKMNIMTRYMYEYWKNTYEKR